MIDESPIYKGMQLTLADDEGNNVSYTLMDAIDYEEHTYVYFIKTLEIDSDEPELFITELEDNLDEVVFNTIENRVLLEELYDVFMEEHPEYSPEGFESETAQDNETDN